jgi:hypothetical protein
MLCVNHGAFHKDLIVCWNFREGYNFTMCSEAMSNHAEWKKKIPIAPTVYLFTPSTKLSICNKARPIHFLGKLCFLGRRIRLGTSVATLELQFRITLMKPWLVWRNNLSPKTKYSLKVAVQWLGLLVLICETGGGPGANVSPETWHPYWCFLCSFLSPKQVAGKHLKLGHDRLHQLPFHFIIHKLSRHSPLHNRSFLKFFAK